MFEDAGEEEDASADVLFFVKFHLDAVAAHETDAVLGDDAGEMAAASDAEDAGNLTFVVSGFAKSIQPQNLLKRFPALIDDGKIIQRKMGDETPEHSFSGGRTNGGGGLAQGRDLFYRGYALDLKIALLIAHGQAVREIPVGTGAVHGHAVRVRMDWASAEIQERKEDFGSFIIAPGGRLAARIPEARGPLPMPRGDMAEAVEGFKPQDF